MQLTVSSRTARSSASKRLRIGAAFLWIGVAAGIGCGGAPANAPARSGKMAPELAAWLGHAAPGARVGVVADFVGRPRSSDMLALGLSDCLGQPAAPSGTDSQVSFDAYDLRHPTPEFGATCVGHPTREALLRLIDNTSVTSLDPWDDK